MSPQTSAIVLLLMFGVGFIFVRSEIRKDRRARLIEETARETELAAEESERGRRHREQQHLRTRREARERARLAFQDLLDENEAKGFDENHPGLKELSGPDYDLIYEARELVRQEIEAMKAANPDWAYSSAVGEKLAPLNEDLSTLKAADEDFGLGEIDLGAPTRIIDCGTAGQVNLYTAAQVGDARKRACVSDYLAFLDRRARAPELAKQIIERTELAEQKEREAEEARLASVTTKLDDLPPLPE